MTVSLFLQIMQILNAMGGAGVAFINIKKYIDENGLSPEDLLPQAHEAKVGRRDLCSHQPRQAMITGMPITSRGVNPVITIEDAAPYALLVMYAKAMHCAEPTSLAPVPDARLAPDWRLLGYITARDSIFRSGDLMGLGDQTCYGYLAQSTADPTLFVAAIRGTNGIIEWVEDGQFFPVTHPVAGKVESGFWGIYSSMNFMPVTGGTYPVAPGIELEIGTKGHLIVLGHSLGAPLAAYLTFDLSAPPVETDRVQGLYFAMPRAGDVHFAQGFDARVDDYQVFNYELDVVPHVPRGPDYCDFSKVIWISPHDAKARICFDLDCHHHIICYAAMLDYALLDWAHMPSADAQNASCIRGLVHEH